jgi:hypothetical protein
MRCKTVGLTMTFILTILLTPFATNAQQLEKVYRIGVLAGSSQSPREQHGHDALQQGLHELG